jgi:hypothetical protein
MAMGEQATLINAAAQAGVKWILPTEYAGDGMNDAMVEAVPLFHPKRAARKQVEELAQTHHGLKWIGVATNPWLEFVRFCLFFWMFFFSLNHSWPKFLSASTNVIH